jgi:hypothetical protein
LCAPAVLALRFLVVASQKPHDFLTVFTNKIKDNISMNPSVKNYLGVVCHDKMLIFSKFGRVITLHALVSAIYIVT